MSSIVFMLLLNNNLNGVETNKVDRYVSYKSIMENGMLLKQKQKLILKNVWLNYLPLNNNKNEFELTNPRIQDVPLKSIVENLIQS